MNENWTSPQFPRCTATEPPTIRLFAGERVLTRDEVRQQMLRADRLRDRLSAP
jgi:hypothetical protein